MRLLLIYIDEDVELIFTEFIPRFKALVIDFYRDGVDGPENALIRPFMGSTYNKIKRIKISYERTAERAMVVAEQERAALLNGLRQIETCCLTTRVIKPIVRRRVCMISIWWLIMC